MALETWDRAKADLHTYTQAVRHNDLRAALTVEERWNIDGLPPQQVSQFLSDVAAGATTEEAMRCLLEQ